MGVTSPQPTAAQAGFFALFSTPVFQPENNVHDENNCLALRRKDTGKGSFISPTGKLGAQAGSQALGLG